MNYQPLFRKCKRCGELREVSKRGLCRDCGFALMQDAVRQLQEKRGPVYEKWVTRTVSGMRGV